MRVWHQQHAPAALPGPTKPAQVLLTGTCMKFDTPKVKLTIFLTRAFFFLSFFLNLSKLVILALRASTLPRLGLISHQFATGLFSFFLNRINFRRRHASIYKHMYLSK